MNFPVAVDENLDTRPVGNEIVNSLILVVQGEQRTFSLEEAGLTLDSSDTQVFDAIDRLVEGIRIPREGVTISRNADRANIFAFPKTQAGIK